MGNLPETNSCQYSNSPIIVRYQIGSDMLPLLGESQETASGPSEISAARQSLAGPTPTHGQHVCVYTHDKMLFLDPISWCTPPRDNEILYLVDHSGHHS